MFFGGLGEITVMQNFKEVVTWQVNLDNFIDKY